MGPKIMDLYIILLMIMTMLSFGKAQNPNCLRNRTLEPPEMNVNNFMKPPEKATHPCLRDCTNSAPMKCEYTFVVEWYYTMTKACYDCPCSTADCTREHCVPADGVPRPIVVANRTLPGPSIEVCEGDEVIVNTVNHMNNGEAITLHWHGIYQKGNQYMDGVFMVTQCPITAHTTFRYNFTADHPGTHFWHAHTGMQRADGLFGALIVRKSKEVNPHATLYDHDLAEHKVVLSDWVHDDNVGIYLNGNFRGGDDEPQSILINGKGSFAVYGIDAATSATTPREIYEVKEGKRYRFRVISTAVANFPMKVWVEGHNVTLISTDGDGFQPLEVDAFFIFGGERYDFVLNASQQIGNYWLKAKGYKQGTGLMGLAVVRYQGAANEVPSSDPMEDRLGVVYQDMRTSYADPDAVTNVNELRSLEPRTWSNKTLRRVYLPVDQHPISNPMFNDPGLYPMGPEGPGWGGFLMPQINRRTFRLFDFPLMSQFDDERAAEGAYDENLCEVEQDGFDHCSTEFCSCTQYIQVDLGETLEIVLIDESTSPFEVEHPFHLHGHAFRILAQGRIGAETSREEVMELDKNGGIVRNYDHPPGKDTVIIPAGGYTVIEFLADNPGWWFLHCHMEFHLEDGMAMVIRVGNQSDLPPIPEGFPRCGDYPSTDRASTDVAFATHAGSINAIMIILIVIIVFLALIIFTLLGVIVCRGRPGDGKGHHQQVPMNAQ